MLKKIADFFRAGAYRVYDAVVDKPPVDLNDLTWKQAKKIWKAKGEPSHIILKPNGKYYVIHHSGNAWCNYCDGVLDWGFPDAHKETEYQILTPLPPSDS